MPTQNFGLFTDVSMDISLQNYWHTKTLDISSTTKAVLISTDRILTALFHMPCQSAKSVKPQ